VSVDGEDPRVVRSRALILDAARRVFLAEGYQGATVERVAAEAGIAKRTIYNLYVDKDGLFRATILSAIAIADAFAAALADEVRHAGDALAPAADAGPRLVGIGVRLAEDTLLGPALPLRRLLVIESARMPDLVVEYRSRAPEAVMTALAGLLGHLASTGRLRVDDPALAAEHFAFLVMGADLDRAMFSGDAPSRSRVRARARAGGEAFVRAYSA
jgi:TetR/AcrR family transcriptional regulator, mexJK operon transcriptional repressor